MKIAVYQEIGKDFPNYDESLWLHQKLRLISSTSDSDSIFAIYGLPGGHAVRITTKTTIESESTRV